MDLRGTARLWNYFVSPSAQNSVIIYNNGDVTEKSNFALDEINDPSVHTFILGGTDYRAEVGSFEYDALLAVGYTFRSNT